MKYTNKNSIPEMIVRAVKDGQWYSGLGEERFASATELLNPVKIILLTKRHRDDISVDVVDSLYMLLGSAAHLVLERANLDSAQQKIMSRMREFTEQVESINNPTDDEISDLLENIVLKKVEGTSIIELAKAIKNDKDIIEKRFQYRTKSGKLITGGIDHYSVKDKCITDYKLTSIWTWIYRNREGSHIEKYTEQLNIYRLFMEAAGYEVNKLRINLIFRDYSKTEASRERNYPNPVEVLEIPLLGLDVVEQLVENKIAEIEKYANTFDDNIPICSPSERWQGHDTYAVMKQGNIKASKVEYSYAAAKSWIDAEAQKIAEKEIQKGKDPYASHQKALSLFSIIKRSAKSTRCLSYCPVNTFCNFYKSLPSELK